MECLQTDMVLQVHKTENVSRPLIQQASRLQRTTDRLQSISYSRGREWYTRDKVCCFAR